MRVLDEEEYVVLEEVEYFEKNEFEVPVNIFHGMESDVLKSIQDAIDELGLGPEEGTTHLRRISPDSREFSYWISQLQKDTGMSYDNANPKLTKWQSLKKNLRL